KFAPYCRDAGKTSITAACLSSLTVRPRAMSGLSRSWCLSASISPFAISCGLGADGSDEQMFGAKQQNPARAAKRPRSVRVAFRYGRREMTQEEQVVGLIFQVTMWPYIAVAAAYVVIGSRHEAPAHRLRAGGAPRGRRAPRRRAAPADESALSQGDGDAGPVFAGSAVCGERPSNKSP